MRSFIAVLERAGELRRVTTEIDWRYEAGAMSRLVTERRGPAPLFERIKDYPGQQIAAVLLGPTKPNLHGRVALALGLPKETPALEIIEVIRQRLKQPHPPTVVPREGGALQAGDPEGRRGRSGALRRPPGSRRSTAAGISGRGDIVVCKDPHGDWMNWGTYRCMITGHDQFSILLTTISQHGGQIHAEYDAERKPMPVALVIGADPASHLVSASPIHHGVSEVDASGGLRGEGRARREVRDERPAGPGQRGDGHRSRDLAR